MKKLLCLILAAAMAVPAAAYAEFSDVSPDSAYCAPVERLSAYGLISGVGGGQFAPEGAVTRAQMARIAVAAAGLEDGADAGGLFLDTPEGYWANGSINTAARNGLLLGYPDGLFRPEQPVTFAEGVTVILRLLGYGTKELGNRYPEAYLKKAGELGLTAGVALYPDDTVNRGNLCRVLDRAMLCEVNGSGTRKSKLLANLDLSVTDECILLGTHAENKEILHDEVRTTIGTYKYRNLDLKEYITGTVKLIVNTDHEAVAVLPVEKEHSRVVVSSVAGNTIAYQSGGTSGTLQCQQDSLFYYQSAGTTFGAVKEMLEAGDVLDVYQENGAFEYAVVTRYELEGPAVVYQDSDRYRFGESPRRVVRDGGESGIDNIRQYDVLYYDAALDTVYAYCDKESGIYEEAIPNKADVKQIVLSGKTYSLETQAAVQALNSSPSAYQFEDYITCLLGRNGEVAAVVGGQSDIRSQYGVLLSCDERTVDGTKTYYAEFLNADGTKNTYKTDKSYQEWRGRVVRYEFQKGVLTPRPVSGGGQLSGPLDKVRGTIGGYALAADGVAVDRVYAPEGKNDPNAEAKVIRLAEIPQNQISEASILYSALDKNGQIAFIVFDHITLAGYRFGIIKSVDQMSSASTYTLDLGGQTETYNTEFVMHHTKGEPVMALIRDSQLKSIVSLVKLDGGSNIGEFTKERITLDGQEYPLYKDAVFYVRDEGYRDNATAFADLDISRIRTVTLYGDKRIQSGGLVRVVRVEMKN